MWCITSRYTNMDAAEAARHFERHDRQTRARVRQEGPFFYVEVWK